MELYGISDPLYLQYRFFVAAEEDDCLHVVSAEPWDLELSQYLSQVCGRYLLPIEVDKDKVDNFHKQVLFANRSKADYIAASMQARGKSSQRERLEVKYNDAPVVKLVNSILEEGVQNGASDIHLEPGEEEMLARLRINGKLQDSLKGPAEYFEAVAARVKYLARLDVTQRLLPQDGKAQIEAAGQVLDLRVSTIPTRSGESIVIRILNKNLSHIDLNKLGMEEGVQKKLRKVLGLNSGLILATGPTGSGKSTSLYAMLQEIHRPDLKILTVEDPVEYEIDGVNQVEVNTRQGIGFASILKHFLRHDPDVIMIGEIRDEETAKMAVQASLTGHLVFSTLHTKDSVSAITRLIQLGIEPSLLSSSLKLVMAQRLIRTLCPKCKKKQRSTKEPYQSMGCSHCHQTGFSNRSALVEYLEVNSELKAAIEGNNPESRINAILKKQKFPRLADLAMIKIKQGETTLAEALPYIDDEV